MKYTFYEVFYLKNLEVETIKELMQLRLMISYIIIEHVFRITRSILICLVPKTT